MKITGLRQAPSHSWRRRFRILLRNPDLNVAGRTWPTICAATAATAAKDAAMANPPPPQPLRWRNPPRRLTNGGFASPAQVRLPLPARRRALSTTTRPPRRNWSPAPTICLVRPRTGSVMLGKPSVSASPIRWIGYRASLSATAGFGYGEPSIALWRAVVALAVSGRVRRSKPLR